MSNSTQNLARPFVLLALGVVIGGAAIFAFQRNANADPTKNYQANTFRPASFQPSGDGKVSGLAELDSMFTELAAFTSDAVVHIQVRPDRQERFNGMMGGDGSGLIIRSDGWIVTNDHVVNNANEVDVILADGRTVKGKVTTIDDDNLDVALVKIDMKNLPVLQFADSDSVRAGQLVLAVGSPFGLDNTVTFGHISAIGRLGMASDGYQQPRSYSGMIQTDASINPGNSGGPLVNVEGKVVGVNTSIYSTSGSSSGIGFAIPANIVKAVADEVVKTGKFDRGQMGVKPRDLKPFEGKDMNLLDGGAYIVESGAAAAEGGLKAGDVITQIDDHKIRNEVDLRVALYEKSPNDKVSVTYYRDGKENKTQIVLTKPTVVAQEAPVQRNQGPFGEMPPDLRDMVPQDKPKLGVYLYEVDETSRDQYGLPGGLEGAVVYRLQSGSLAERAGLQIGDVITGLDDTKVSSPEQVVDFINRAQAGDEITVKFVRMEKEKAVEKTVRIRLR